VQDLHLFLVQAKLSGLRQDHRLLHFTHTPFCGPNSIRVLPTDVGDALCASLASAPAGFHTARWAHAYEACTRELRGPDAGSQPFWASFGPDHETLAAVAASDEARRAAEALDDLVGDRLLLLRTDRIDPSKNIVRGFLAFDRLLEARPDLRGRVVFVAMLNASRQGMAEYLAYANEVEQAAARVNDRWATRGWQPVTLDVRDDFARTIAGLGRYDVLLVNPLRDGLNLVAKEGPLLNRNEGTVCLSREAGAFEELGPAVMEVHPYDLDQTAGVLAEALDAEAGVRTERAAKLRELAGARTPADWLDDLLAHVRGR
jgi:trehalose 6-phosphate synthase